MVRKILQTSSITWGFPIGGSMELIGKKFKKEDTTIHQGNPFQKGTHDSYWADIVSHSDLASLANAPTSGYVQPSVYDNPYIGSSQLSVDSSRLNNSITINQNISQGQVLHVDHEVTLDGDYEVVLGGGSVIRARNIIIRPVR
jgi:hypothetical protein